MAAACRKCGQRDAFIETTEGVTCGCGAPFKGMHCERCGHYVELVHFVQGGGVDEQARDSHLRRPRPTRRCPKCGLIIDEDVKWCFNCDVIAAGNARRDKGAKHRPASAAAQVAHEAKGCLVVYFQMLLKVFLAMLCVVVLGFAYNHFFQLIKGMLGGGESSSAALSRDSTSKQQKAAGRPTTRPARPVASSAPVMAAQPSSLQGAQVTPRAFDLPVISYDFGGVRLGQTYSDIRENCQRQGAAISECDTTEASATVDIQWKANNTERGFGDSRILFGYGMAFKIMRRLYQGFDEGGVFTEALSRQYGPSDSAPSSNYRKTVLIDGQAIEIGIEHNSSVAGRPFESLSDWDKAQAFVVRAVQTESYLSYTYLPLKQAIEARAEEERWAIYEKNSQEHEHEKEERIRVLRRGL